MPANTVWLSIDGERVVPALQQAMEKLDSAQTEVVVDFSSVQRVDASALRVMEKLLAMADEKAVKIGLHSVNVDIYKTLKLAKLAPRFTFVS
jgi:anti-anti-sigma regulatory factor